MILFDTDICVEILRKNHEILKKRAQFDGSIGISFMSVAELYYGAAKSSNPVKNEQLIQEFLLTLEIIQTDNEILKKFGKLKYFLYKEKAILPDADILIAAAAYIKADKLITGNVKHFTRFPNLVIENWRG
ncbi:MAG: type II toxin-antitoxin system VapC family toxin [Spirochaetia bacterium]